MHRIYQSQRKLRASIASAAKAEEELLALSQEQATQSSSSGETKNSGRKRSLEDAIQSDNNNNNNNNNEGDIADQVIDKIDSDVNGQDTSSAPTSSPPAKKTAPLRSPEASISTSTIEPIPATGSANSITPTNDKVSTPDRTIEAIDLRTPSLPLCASSEVEIIVNPQPSISINPETIKDHRKNDDDENDEEIQVLASTTINPNIQYPHKRVDCGLYNFSIDPKKFCDKCYCSICDIPAKNCERWDDHCFQRLNSVAPPQQEIVPNTEEAAVAMDTGNNDTMEDDENDENDDEIEVLASTTINPNIQYPHKRTDCGAFSFATDPTKFCEKCYCLVCDIPAKECKQWGDHATQTCRPASKENEMTDDEGYDVTDEILLESPTTTARNYHNQRRRGNESMVYRVNRSGEISTEGIGQDFHDEKLRILEVLSRKLKVSLKVSEGARITLTENGDTKPTQQRNAMEGDIPQLGLHSSFFVEGIKIGWPFPKIMLPQRQMAMHIVKGLKRSLHVVVESPTGTGKSVAILCSVLAWQRYHMQTTNKNTTGNNEEEEKHPRIIYCSRTHSQVTQMVASLKKTPYRPTMTVLGSRERLCIHKKLTGANKKKNKVPLNLACQIRRLNTESDRKRRLNNHEYNDDCPRPHEEYNGDDIGEDEIVADIPSQNDDPEDETGARPKKPKATCPHFRQLSSERTSKMVVKRFMGGHRLKGDGGGGCCGNSSAVGGEESAFGVHDMEDLVRFGKNPFKEENISVYRGRNGKFGFLVNNNMNDKGEITRGCHVVSLVDGGAAAFEARLEAGDKILKINGKDVRTWNKRKVVDLLSQTPKDQPARLIVLREYSDTRELLDPEKDLIGVEDIDHPAEVYSESSVCPYYLSRAIQGHAELTFAPYNYILDPGIRRVMNISLKNAVVVLDEAHNVESTLCEGGSGKYGEFDLCQLVCTLAHYSRRTLSTGDIELVNTGEKVDTAKLAHDLLMFVEKLILHMQTLRQKFETSPGRTKLENDYKKFRTPDNHEVELTYDGPTGYGIKGAAVGCQPFLTRLGITKEQCAQLLEYALSMEQTLFGGKSEGDDRNESTPVVGESSNVLTILVELLTKLVTATKNAEHYYISCVVQANGNLDHAFGIEDENVSRRFKKKPRTVPFISPRTIKTPLAYLPVCQHKECNPRQEFFNPHDAVRHGDYCNGSTPPFECHLVLRLLSPGLLMREISQECRSVILASGSLAPLPSVCAELNLFGKDSSSTPASQKSIITGKQLPTISQSMLDSIVEGRVEKLYTNRLQTTPKPLEANHVVNLQKQLLAVSIGHFPTGEKLTVSYSNYNNNPSFLPKFGHAVASVIEGVPRGGCLVFFPSYSFLKKCVACWNPESNNYSYNNRNNENNYVWERLLRSKGKVIVEPTGSQEDFEAARDDFKDTIAAAGSCILLAVFRGKMSEGISFDDDNSRAVICIGMPLPNWTDRSVKAKQAYNDEQRKLRKNTSLLPGREFYAQQAYRAISQALGRCIRHGADYGTVILMDSRHCHDGSPTSGGVCRAHSNLPKWMRGAVHTLSMEREGHRGRSGHSQPKMIYGGYAGLRREMRQFFARAPIASREVFDQWKADRERALSASSRGSNVIFHSDAGNWTTVAQASSNTGDGGDSELANDAGIQI